MSDGPVLRATSEWGETVDDPSEDAMFTMLEDIETGSGNFLIVDSLVERAGDHYAQAYRNEDGTYVVEYRDGDADHHFGTVVADMRAAHALLVGWAFGVRGWRESCSWSPVRV
jgi:hypothetical protein